MSLGHSPSIVTSGLQLYLDAANSKSYPGSGTNWADLSGNNLNATLQNSPTYNSSNNGSIVFNGTNQFASIPNNSLLNASLSMTLSAWIYITSFRGYMSILGKGDGGSGYDFRIDSSSSLNLVKYTIVDQNVTIPTLSSATWYNISAVQGATSVTYYINGVSTGSFSNSSSYVTNSSEFRVARNRDTIYSSIRVSNVLFYNRNLSQSEISQNFNATRGRYGI